MTKPIVGIITPTYNRPFKTIQRCIQSVKWQTYSNIVHIICHDGPWSSPLSLEPNNNIIITNTPERTNSYGAGIRQYVLDNNITTDIKYLVHLDDDNVIFPDFVEEHVEVLESNSEVDFSICQILHNGPLPANLGTPPKIISGIPPIFRNIDTLQIMVRTPAMKICGWTQYTGDKGYCNDGYTYERLGKLFKWAEIPKLLAVHI